VRALALIALIACGSSKPKPVPPVPETIAAPPLECALPELPGPIAPTIGWPTPDQVMISKTDFLLMIDFVSALRDWVFAAQACFDAQRPTFAKALNSFLSREQ